MDVNALSGWCLSQTQGEEESIEGYLKAWDAIKDLDIGPSHVNLAAEIANRFMTGGHYANMVHFVNNLNETFMQKLKENEKFVRALIALRMTQRKYEEVFTLLQNGQFSKKEGLLEMWDEAHYREWEERMGKPLNALLRYRIRQRFLPPQHICPNGSRPTTRLPDQALKILKEWLMQHPKDPYPTKLDKELLMKTSGLSLSQVKTWFANARRRLRLKKEKGEEAILSEQEASSDSPEDPLSGEDGGPIKEEDGEKIYHKSEYEGQRLGDSGHGRSQGSYPYHHIPYGRFPVKPEPRVKPEPWSDFKQGMYPVSTSASHIQFVPVGRTSSTYIPCPPPHTSQYLKAMAGMCEEISPATYHLGAPRRARSAVCSSLSELHPLHHPRSQACPVVQDESYPYLYEKHTQSEPSSTFPRTCYPDYPQRQSKWYPGHDSPHDQRMIRSYSVSAPPSLQNVNGHLSGQTSTVTTGHQGQGDETWSAYPRTAYREYPYVPCNPSCSRSSQAACPQGSEGGHSSMTSIQRPVPSQTLPMMRHDQVSSSLPEQNTYLHWRPSGESQRGPLPAFHTSFDLHKLPLPMARSYQLPQGQGHDLLRLPNEQMSNHTMTSLRRRHKSQPVITSSAPSYLPSSNSTFTPVVFKQSLEKRSASFDCLEGSIKLSKTESPSSVVPVTSTQNLTNECPAHQRPLMISTVQTTPPNAHVHEKPQSLSSPSVGPSLSTNPPANCSTTESREGMKEVALVLLDLSNKCPVGDPRE